MTPPLIYTQLEEWSTYCKDPIVISLIKSKLNEIFGVSATEEQCMQMTYSFIEFMQMKETRVEIANMIIRRIKQKYNITISFEDAIKLMEDKNIYNSFKKYYESKNKNSHSFVEIDNALNKNLLGIMPGASIDEYTLRVRILQQRN